MPRTKKDGTRSEAAKAAPLLAPLEPVSEAAEPAREKPSVVEPLPDTGGGSELIPRGEVVLKLPKDKSSPIKDIQEVLAQEVIGQERAITHISRALIRSRVGFRDPLRPIAVMFFAGPTGVGKTETARALAMALHGDPRKMIRVDCSEYSEPHSVSRLIGSPPGYVGSDLPVVFSKEAVESEPNTLILFDEIEKASFRLHHLLLQIMDEGRLTLARRTRDDDGIIDFTQCIIILTSNVGAAEIDATMREHRIGFIHGDRNIDQTDQDIYETVKEATRKMFNPEFRNRITDFIVFRALTRESLYKILQKILNISAARFANLGFRLILSTEARDFLVDNGLSLELGVRPLIRAVEKYIDTRLAELVAYGEIIPGDIIEAVLENGEIVFKRAKRTKSQVVGENGAPTQTEIACKE